MNYNSNLAYELEYYEKTEPTQKTVTKARKRYSLKNRAKFIKMLNLAIVFAVAFAICFRYVQIYGQRAEINATAAKLEAMATANTQLELNIEQMVDTKSVEEYATNVLGMKKPDRYQISYIVASGEDVMETTKVAQNKSIFGIIMNKLAGNKE